MRILLGNAPTTYRETLAAVLTAVRPAMEVTTVLPAELDAAIAAQAPDFVVCSKLTRTVETRARGWALLYPAGSATCIVTVGGQRSVMPDMQLETLLTTVDRLAE